MLTIPNGNILEIDFSRAKSIPGVVDFVETKEVQEINSASCQLKDEPVVAEKEVHFFDQTICFL
jgi:xanthine dehydrogenase molybdopterin-binding subunit B